MAEQLRPVIAGLPFLADRPWKEIGWGRMRIELLSLWRVELLLEPDRLAGAASGVREVVLSRVEWAGAPDGRCWDYGCQRDDWTLGPDSRLVDPLGFLAQDERQQLAERLQQAACWPEPLPSLTRPAGVPPAGPRSAEAITTPLPLAERIRSRRPPRRPAQRRQKPQPHDPYPIIFPSGLSG